MTTKVCSKCKVEKDVGEFYNDKSKKDGYRERCKKCNKIQTDEYRLHPEMRPSEIRNKQRIGFKICSRCKVEKPIEEFSKNKSAKDGRDSWCKKCKHEYHMGLPQFKHRKTSLIDGYKFCSRCGIEKPTCEFHEYISKCEKLKPASVCKECVKLYYEQNVKNKGTCVDCGKPIHAKSTRCNGCAIIKIHQDPEWLKNNTAAMKKRWEDPKYVKRNLDMILNLSQDPEWLRRNAIGVEKRTADPTWYERVLIQRTGFGIWYGHPIINTTTKEYYKKYYNTPVGKESRLRSGSKRRATKSKISTRDQDSFWKMTPERIKRIINRQNGMCPICNLPLGDHYQRDHIIPLHVEVSNRPNHWCPGLIRGNVQITHKNCNAGKQNRWDISRAIDTLLITEIQC